MKSGKSNPNHFTAMKIPFVLLILAPLAAAAPAIVVRPVATVSATQVIVDLTADTGGEALRGFGVRVSYNGVLALQSAGSYGGLWFLRSEDGVSHPYTDVRTPGVGAVTVVGGRFDGSRPADGLAGDGILLATLVFQRTTTGTIKFEFGLAEPSPFTNFANAAGDPLDSGVVFAGLVTNSAAPDTDHDGLPDPYEMATFGNLTTASATSDFDGDGESDLDEYIRGTDAKNPASRSGFEVVVQPDATKLLRWQGSPARVYDILWSPDLGPFQEIQAGIPGAAALLQRLDAIHNASPKGFYHLRTTFPTAGR